MLNGYVPKRIKVNSAAEFRIATMYGGSQSNQNTLWLRTARTKREPWQLRFMRDMEAQMPALSRLLVNQAQQFIWNRSAGNTAKFSKYRASAKGRESENARRYGVVKAARANAKDVAELKLAAYRKTASEQAKVAFSSLSSQTQTVLPPKTRPRLSEMVDGAGAYKGAEQEAMYSGRGWCRC